MPENSKDSKDSKDSKQEQWVKVPPRSGLYWVYFHTTGQVSVASVSCEEDWVVLGVNVSCNEMRTTVTQLRQYANDVGHLYFYPADVPPPPVLCKESNSNG